MKEKLKKFKNLTLLYHPGKMLYYWMTDNNVSYAEMSHSLDITVKELKDFINGKLDINNSLKEKLEHITSISKEYWAFIQAEYDAKYIEIIKFNKNLKNIIDKHNNAQDITKFEQRKIKYKKLINQEYITILTKLNEKINKFKLKNLKHKSNIQLNNFSINYQSIKNPLLYSLESAIKIYTNFISICSNDTELEAVINNYKALIKYKCRDAINTLFDYLDDIVELNLDIDNIEDNLNNQYNRVLYSKEKNI